MLPLRFPWMWRALGWTLVVGVCIGSLLPAADVPSFGISDKIQHAGAYFLLTSWFVGMYPRTRYIWVGLWVFGLGFALDLLQLGTATRYFDLLDVAADLGGVVVALLLSYALLGGWCLRVERGLGVASS